MLSCELNIFGPCAQLRAHSGARKSRFTIRNLEIEFQKHVRRHPNNVKYNVIACIPINMNYISTHLICPWLRWMWVTCVTVQCIIPHLVLRFSLQFKIYIPMLSYMKDTVLCAGCVYCSDCETKNDEQFVIFAQGAKKKLRKIHLSFLRFPACTTHFRQTTCLCIRSTLGHTSWRIKSNAQ